MFKHLTVGKKVALGFTAVLLLTGILGTIGVVQIKKVDSGVMDLADVHIPLAAAASELDATATNQNLQASLYAIHKEKTQLDTFTELDGSVDKTFETLKEIINGDHELVAAGWLRKVDEMAQMHDVFGKSCKQMMDTAGDANSDATAIQTAADEVEAAYEPFMGKVDEFLATNTEETQNVSTGATSAADAAIMWMTVVSIASVFVGTILAVFIARGIVRALKKIIQALTEGSEQVASASGQVSSASQSLAEGATEQAAGLEETSSSLEEMSSMTKQNADNAQQANTLASEARKAADNGTEAMGRMNSAIEEIQKSSDETAKIIKVIDEIAFQTNLLALNAAVEAARAGEAGKGFAVVAEEVRNLAMRSAEAAKNTSSMIEESVKNSKNGVDIAGEVAKVLEEIVQGVGKTTDLVSEIAAASQEQAQGIDQVNTAVAQMDKVTQQNAANAEESASASEELSAQAESMNQIVFDLAAMVGGRAKDAGPVKSSRKARKPSQPVQTHQGLSKSDHAFHSIAKGASKTSKQKVAAEKSIPLDDHEEDFSDFND